MGRGGTSGRDAVLRDALEVLLAPGGEVAVAAAAFDIILYGPNGGAVQVDPIKPTLQAPESKRLILSFDEPLSSFALKFNLRRYTTASRSGRLWIGARGGTPSSWRPSWTTF
jgi:hypothetical protein